MYLKNTSKVACIVINTVRGKVGIKPQEIVDIQYKILPPVSKSLVEVDAEDYLTFRQGTANVMEEVIEAVEHTVQPAPSVASEQRLADMEKQEDEVLEIQDTGIMGFVNSLIEKKDEDASDASDALVVTETDSTDEVAILEQQLADLKLTWQQTRNSRTKEKLTKEMKELQKQLKKIKN